MKSIEINPTCEFHLLRHFSKVSDKYKKSLVGKEHYYFDYSTNNFVKQIITENEIDLAIKTLGGKFNSTKPFNTPVEVIKLVRTEIDKKDIVWGKDGVNLRANFEIEFQDYVGVENLIEEYKLSSEDQKNIVTKPRSELPGETGIVVKTLAGCKTNLTNKISVQLLDTPSLPFLWLTAHPKNDLNIDDTKDFWSQVVILI
jgi:hypothetical protein